VIPRIALRDGYTISRIIKGGWHLAGDHAPIEPAQACKDMATFVDAGITTFDCADIYTGVELLIGSFRKAYPSHAKRIQVHTKFVPDLASLPTLDGRGVESIIDRSLMRLGVERVDLVQFHWWDYTIPRYVETALELERLQRAGKIAHIGLTNFDTTRLSEFIDAGIPVLTHQVQYSLLDDRPTHGMAELCRLHDISLLCYGTVSGGFLSERWLGKPAPTPGEGNRSLVKYRLIIDEFGGWELFQALLRVLSAIAVAHNSDIATIGTRVIVDRPQVAAAIVGAVNTSHLDSHVRIDTVHLSDDERRSIERVTDRRQGPAGDVYALERDRSGIHGRIMKYGLNALTDKRIEV
jgi:aryl-alcohol dehydrogenase-like predicted oxidoreductase